MENRVLIIDYDEKHTHLLTLRLQYEGYTVECSRTGEKGIQWVQTESWSMILLAMQLPDRNGMDVLRQIRTIDEGTPVILLSEEDHWLYKVRGLDQGANDYMVKPVQVAELMARIRVCLRHRQIEGNEDEASQQDVTMAMGELVIHPGLREVTQGDTKIDLTPTEFNLLMYLVENRNQVMTREQILQHVWGYEFFGNTNIVDVYIRYLRQKLDYPFKQKRIRTCRGIGYLIRDSSQRQCM